METGVNGVLFEISPDGKVLENSMYRVCSTFPEGMPKIIEGVIPHVQKYFEFLLKRALAEKEKGGV